MNRDLINCIKYDIKEGIYKKYFYYITFMIAIILIGLDASTKLKLNIDNPGFFDILLKIMEGNKEFVYVKGGEAFEMPFNYFIIFVLMGFGSAYYANKEWHLRGSLYIIRYRDKYSWWISKSIWNIINVFILYLFLIIGILLTCVITGGLEKSLHEGIYYALINPIQLKGTGNIILNVLVIGFLTIVALNQLQITIQMLLSPIVGFLTYLIIIISSAFYLSPFFPGDYLMVVRGEISRTDGVNVVQGIILMSFIWIISFVIGIKSMKKRDIF